MGVGSSGRESGGRVFPLSPVLSAIVSFVALLGFSHVLDLTTTAPSESLIKVRLGNSVAPSAPLSSTTPPYGALGWRGAPASESSAPPQSVSEEPSSSTPGPPVQVDVVDTPAALSGQADAAKLEALSRWPPDLVAGAQVAAPLAGKVLSAQELRNNQRSQEGNELLPLVYIHIPKTGTSFATTIAHYGCPRIRKDFMVQEVSWPYGDKRNFRTFYSLEKWCNGSFLNFSSGHNPIRMGGCCGDTPLERVVTFFRLPKVRIVSAYFHNFHDCPVMRTKGHCRSENSRCEHMYQTPIEEQEKLILEYSRCVYACMSHMLTNNACGAEGSKEKKRGLLMTLQNGPGKAVSVVPRLGFVGLTEQFPLSICLFHARFGGTCYRASFLNNRPSNPNTTQRYAQFLNFIASVDTSWDDAVYAAAATRFWREVRLYNVTNELCRTRVCPQAAEFFFE